MRIYLLRHGETAYNRQKRYQGTRDVPLSDAGRAALRPSGIEVPAVFTSPLSRAAESARIVFPGARAIVVDDLREMSFGSFEGRTYREMERDPDYLAWVAGRCEGRCPDGESREEFIERTCRAFAGLVEAALGRGDEVLAIMAHGGTQMAVMPRFADPASDYYDWCAPNGGGYVLEADESAWRERTHLDLVGPIAFAVEAAGAAGAVPAGEDA